MDDDTWVDIEGCDGHYRVSDSGRVQSVARINAGGRQIRGRILKPDYTNGCGIVSLRKGNKTEKHMVARLVATHFIGVSDLEVHHIDGDSRNNRSSNLVYKPIGSDTKRQYEQGSRIAPNTGKHKADNPLSLPRVLVSKDTPWFGYWVPNTVEAGILLNRKPSTVTGALTEGKAVNGFYVYGERRSDAA